MTQHTNVIELRIRLTQKYGDHIFLLCECQNNAECPSGMLPVAMHDAQGPFIAALVCPECENEVPIIYGRPA